jgi:hypothetical protein
MGDREFTPTTNTIMHQPLTIKQRIVRLIVTLLGHTYDDPRLDCTSEAHPAYERGWNAACVTAAREITMLSTSPALNPKQRLKALQDFAAQLHKRHQPEDTDARD